MRQSVGSEARSRNRFYDFVSCDILTTDTIAAIVQLLLAINVHSDYFQTILFFAVAQLVFNVLHLHEVTICPRFSMDIPLYQRHGL